MRNMIKGFLPLVKSKLKDIDPFVTKLLNDQELLPGEDAAKIILQSSELRGAQIVVAAFSGDTVVRIISTEKADEFISKLISKI